MEQILQHDWIQQEQMLAVAQESDSVTLRAKAEDDRGHLVKVQSVLSGAAPFPHSIHPEDAPSQLL